MFKNRKDAGRKLAKKLNQFEKKNPMILALPRGGVPVGFEVAKQLHAQLSVIVARKIGAPGREELGVGAIAEGRVRVLDLLLIERLGIPSEVLLPIIKKEEQELARRVKLYRDDEPLILKNRTIILVDDGIATGGTLLAAVRTLKKQKAKNIIVAAPICAREAAGMLRSENLEVICLIEATDFPSIGSWYRDFEQVEDDRVLSLLNSAGKKKHSSLSSI